MRAIAVLVIFIKLSGFTFAQETETRKIGSFKGVKVAEGIDVYLKKGDKESLRLEVTGVSPADVLTELSGDYLKIHMRDGRYKNHTAKVYVTYVSIDKLSVSSAGNIFSEGVIKADQLSLSASSAGSIDIQIEAQTVTVSASSAADIELSGKSRKLSVDASSAGEVDAYDLESEVVDVDASSAGSVKVNARKEITAEASSGGSVRYKGNPERSNTNTSSGGSVKKSS
jgi:hypothetical protein